MGLLSPDTLWVLGLRCGGGDGPDLDDTVKGNDNSEILPTCGYTHTTRTVHDMSTMR